MSNSALQKSEDSWYDIVRRADGCVVFSFPSSGRHLIYRVNGMVSMRPLLDDEEVFTPNGFMHFIRRLGYRVTPPSDNMKPTA
ncbi:hypothetical protein J5048_004903 [Salmonella enterica]|nr:hypothetical protein [Salmonella enterica subsp. enterica serovar Santiago]EHG2695627.1 hypothetical protein [Salmonella enterica]EBH8970006.1 hypothetical protein [Salmonella enterica subsp. enterica serovar Santiago]EHG2700347.1 hypothetical protein [Salmonella enterica]EHG7371168.1 hypothetical protein [Salmonella enterica]